MILPFLISFFLFLHLEAKQLKVNISAKSAILINAENGNVLFEKDPHKPSYPASITKIATAVYALEKRGNCLDEIATAHPDCLAVLAPHVKHAGEGKYPAHWLEVGGSHIGIKEGEQLDLRTLLYGLMLASGNDAANVIAKHVSGSVPAFMEGLNAFLKEKGVVETHFCNPHGLTHSKHVTTAADMAKIAQLGMKHPIFREIVKTVRAVRPETNKQTSSFFLQSNRLLKSGQYFYPKAIGIKTGYTSAAGHTLVAAAHNQDRTVIAVLLGCEDVNQRYRDAIALFEAAFSEKKETRTLLTKEYDRYTRAISGGRLPLEAALKEDFKIEYFASEEPKFKAQVKWYAVKMPVLKEQFVGQIELVSEDNKVIKTAPLYSTRDIPKTWWFLLFEWKKQVILIALMLCVSATAIVYCCKKSKMAKKSSKDNSSGRA